MVEGFVVTLAETGVLRNRKWAVHPLGKAFHPPITRRRRCVTTVTHTHTERETTTELRQRCELRQPGQPDTYRNTRK